MVAWYGCSVVVERDGTGVVVLEGGGVVLYGGSLVEWARRWFAKMLNK